MHGNPWTIKEIQIMKKNFPILSKKNLIKLLIRRSWPAIQNEAYGKLNLKRPDRAWTTRELNFLKKMYSKIGLTITKEYFLKLLPKRNWKVIRGKASELSVKTHYNGNPPQGNVAILLSESLEAYYWAGFIAADGNISHNKQLRITLSQKDIKHLQKFGQFIKCSNFHKRFVNGCEQVILTIGDCFLVPKFAKKFDLKHDKTYDPPNLDWLRGNKFLAFFAGYIDGDGSIKTFSTGRKRLSFTVHSSWFSILNKFIYKTYKILKLKPSKFRGVKTNKLGYAYISLSDTFFMNKFKASLSTLNLPLLTRKWEVTG